ncbi:urea ABC transporter permease subunit UrtB [Hydrogenobacter sp. T-2]|uniref:urea ABC transporter permease subunit UrtB n=1 Tax=Pampinifervens diazotrophicum TaxID=1632018 RepID=UPI002B25BEAD|nr:urea ABC transporter permease subunit UrtB [Hydrogenobacter sp. T-2]WPM31278.1 urea ABC transporter permease subunit UrtB [Hydrogenobacter sp. T-2]
MDFGFFINQLFNGISISSILFMTAVGLALSFGYMRIINMAHGEFLMLGGYSTYLVQKFYPSEAYPIFALLFSFIFLSIFGFFLWALVIKHVQSRPLDTLLLTWGVSIILQQLARDIFGSTGVSVVPPSWLSITITFGELKIPSVRLFIIFVMMLSILALYLLFFKSDLGLRLRATSKDRETASSLGVNSEAVNAFVFAIGAGMAGVAGSALALISSVTPTIGLSYIVDSFMVVIFGGVGSLLGTLISSLIIGTISALTGSFMEISLAKALILILVVIFMQFKPTGLVSIKVRE